MRKKLLAAIMSAAMVACASPVIALAEPVVDTETETTTEGTVDDTEGTDVTEETPVADEALTKVQPLSEPAPAAEPGEDVRTGEITDQASLEGAIAAAKEGDEINLTGKTINLERTLAVNKSVVLTGGTLVGMSNGTYVRDNLVTLGQGINVTLNGVSITTDAANGNALVAWGTNLTVNNLTVDHTKAVKGAPMIINNGAKATFSGKINLTLGAASWYGVNVDNATADFSDATLNVIGATGTQSAVCIDGESSEAVTGVNLTEVVTARDGGDDKKQIAYVSDSNLPQFVDAKRKADVESITLKKDVSLSAPLHLKENMTVNGNGFSFNGTSAIGEYNVVTTWADGIAINNLTIKTDAANKSALHIYKSSATLTNVTLDNRETAGGAGMIVNGGTANVNGTLDILLGAKSWGGINVDGKNGVSAVNFANGSKVTVQDNSGKSLSALYIENATVNPVSISGAEAAGLAQDANGNFVVKEETKPAEDNKPATNTDKKTEDKKDSKTPKTGDSNALLPALMALAASGAAAAVVVKKRNEMSR